MSDAEIVRGRDPTRLELPDTPDSLRRASRAAMRLDRGRPLKPLEQAAADAIADVEYLAREDLGEDWKQREN